MKTLLTTLTLFLTLSSSAQVSFFKDADGVNKSTHKLSVCDGNDEVLQLNASVSEDGKRWEWIGVWILNGERCNADNRLKITFKRGGSIFLKSTFPMNCDGFTQFKVTPEIEDVFRRNSEVYKISLYNSRNQNISKRWITGKVPAADRDYFIQLMYAIDNHFRYSNNESLGLDKYEAAQKKADSMNLKFYEK